MDTTNDTTTSGPNQRTGAPDTNSPTNWVSATGGRENTGTEKANGPQVSAPLASSPAWGPGHSPRAQEPTHPQAEGGVSAMDTTREAGGFPAPTMGCGSGSGPLANLAAAGASGAAARQPATLTNTGKQRVRNEGKGQQRLTSPIGCVVAAEQTMRQGTGAENNSKSGRPLISSGSGANHRHTASGRGVPPHTESSQLTAAPVRSVASQLGQSTAHQQYVKVLTRNAICDTCNKRHSSVIQKCLACGLTTCKSCHNRRAYDSRHNLANLDLDWYEPPRDRHGRIRRGVEHGGSDHTTTWPGNLQPRQRLDDEVSGHYNRGLVRERIRTAPSAPGPSGSSPALATPIAGYGPSPPRGPGLPPFILPSSPSPLSLDGGPWGLGSAMHPTGRGPAVGSSSRTNANPSAAGGNASGIANGSGWGSRAAGGAGPGVYSGIANGTTFLWGASRARPLPAAASGPAADHPNDDNTDKDATGGEVGGDETEVEDEDTEMADASSGPSRPGQPRRDGRTPLPIHRPSLPDLRPSPAISRSRGRPRGVQSGRVQKRRSAPPIISVPTGGSVGSGSGGATSALAPGRPMLPSNGNPLHGSWPSLPGQPERGPGGGAVGGGCPSAGEAIAQPANVDEDVGSDNPNQHLVDNPVAARAMQLFREYQASIALSPNPLYRNVPPAVQHPMTRYQARVREAQVQLIRTLDFDWTHNQAFLYLRISRGHLLATDMIEASINQAAISLGLLEQPFWASWIAGRRSLYQVYP
ncbi:hypothetical protein F4780DRAFT_738965 [Xylariomycetidae sp. FL0641]|nr:hypothetical protein F4780DRAFT_738965 [Xylariomycetidae sp. FL0641]